MRIKTQYLQSNRTTQFDSLALNLTRIQLLARSGSDELVVQHLVRESQFFIEWAVSTIDLEADLALATELVDLQRLLSRWKLGWPELWASEEQRQEMANLVSSNGVTVFMDIVNC
ncbi:hypothetical protein [Phormidium sp. FACHB-1136]|uniref:hypothetical protein n=1 Tax=Phormidium sp. FACHB-1136 TaxID=2692848 RepID=UPI0018EFEFEA|nr:hypothetical protein [Phormidium sp. FACHB-1136]